MSDHKCFCGQVLTHYVTPAFKESLFYVCKTKTCALFDAHIGEDRIDEFDEIVAEANRGKGNNNSGETTDGDRLDAISFLTHECDQEGWKKIIVCIGTMTGVRNEPDKVMGQCPIPGCDGEIYLLSGEINVACNKSGCQFRTGVRDYEKLIERLRGVE